MEVSPRARGRIILLLAVGLAGLVAAPGAAAPRGRFGVGDSIMLSASDELARYRVHVNAEVGRQFDEGLRVLKARAARGTLPRLVIVHLGTNGPVGADACDAVAVVAGTSHRVFLVTVRVPRPWQDRNNATFNACALLYARVHVLHWYAFSGRHPDWFADDGYHLTPLGQTAYAEFVDAGVQRIMRVIARRGA
jgi:lysophospholipase L1-like esterase